MHKSKEIPVFKFNIFYFNFLLEILVFFNIFFCDREENIFKKNSLPSLTAFTRFSLRFTEMSPQGVAKVKDELQNFPQG